MQPSTIARTIAAAQWPEVQSQRKLAKGIYSFSCAGHGGVVAIIGEADLPEDAIEAARKAGLIELVVVASNGYKRTRRYTTEKYTAESLRKMAANHPSSTELFECWVGEEDCAYATIALVSPDMRAGNVKAGGSPITEQEALEICRSYHEDFLVALGYEPAPDGQIAKRNAHQALLDSGAFIRCSAIGFGDSSVRVTFCNQAGETREYLMAYETYRAIPLLTDATPDDYAKHGELVQGAESLVWSSTNVEFKPCPLQVGV